MLDAAASLLFNPMSFLAWSILVLAGVCLIVRQPSLLPGKEVFFFREKMTLLAFTFITVTFLTTLAHELAHLLAARAAGLNARISFGHRLWVLVAQTDLSGVWALPRSRRFLPLLAGPMLDAASASALVIVTLFLRQGWAAAHPLAFQFLRALILSYLLRIVWQCYLFVRTDFYYVLVMLFDCKNLMGDTADFLRNQARRVFGLKPTVDQSILPAREMRIVQWYSIPWLAGRCLAFSVLIFVQIPVTLSYASHIASRIWGSHARPAEIVDSLVMGGIGVLSFSLGLFLWIKSLVQKRRRPDAAVRLAT